MKTDQLRIGSALAYISVFLNIIIGLVLAPLSIRYLGQAQYGLYQLIWSFVGYIGILDFGFCNSVIRYVAKFRAENDRRGEENFIAIVFIIYGIIFILISIVGIFLYRSLNDIFSYSLTATELELAKRLFLIMLLNFTVSIILNIFPAIINAYESFLFQRGLTLLRILLRSVIMISILFLGFQSIAIAVLDTILTFIFLIIQAIYVFKILKVKIKLHKFEWPLFKEVTQFSFFIFIIMLVDQINWKVDQLIIGVSMDAANVAIYSIAIQFPMYYMMLSTAISGVFQPRAMQMVVKNADNNELTNLLIKTARIQWIIMGVIILGFALFGKQFIELWLGGGFIDAYYIALIIMLPLAVALLQTVGYFILQAKNMHAFRAYIYLGFAVFNVVITVLLVDRLGIIGAAIGTAVSFIAGNIIMMNLYYHFKLNLNIVRFFKETYKGLIFPTFISIIAGVLLNLIFDYSWVGLIIKIFIFSSVYSLFFWLIGLNGDEKLLLKIPLKNYISKTNKINNSRKWF